MAKKEGKIVRQLSVRLLLSTLIIFLTIAMLVSALVYNSLEIQVKEGLHKDAQIIASGVNAYLIQGDVLVEQLATNEEIKDYLTQNKSKKNDVNNEKYVAITRDLKTMEDSNEVIMKAWLAITETNNVIFSDLGYKPKTEWIYKERPWTAHLENKKETIYTEPYIDSFSGEIVVSIIKPLIENGKVIAVYGIDINSSDLYTYLSNYQIGITGYPVLISERGTAIYHKDRTQIMKVNVTEIKGKLGEYGREMIQGKSSIGEYNYKGTDKYFAYAPVEVSNWSIGTMVNQDETLQEIELIMNSMMVMFGIAILFLVIMIFLSIKRALKNVPKLLSNMSSFSEGNLSENYVIEQNNEIGRISKAFNDAAQSIREVVIKATQSSNDILKASEVTETIAIETKQSLNEVAVAISQMSEGSADQAIQSEKSVMTIHTLSQEISSVIDEAQSLNNKVKEIHKLSDEGSHVINELGIQSDKNATSVNQIRMTVEEMDQSAKEINDIVTLINAISNQTNLLALNASIEAARAGEAGKGFAVVADEIRGLAVQTNQATEEIQKRIDAIQEKSSEAVKQATYSGDIVEENSKIVSNTSSIFTEIIKNLTNLYEASQSTQSIAQNMNHNKELMVDYIEQISATSEEVSASMEEISASTEEQLAVMDNLSTEATALKELAKVLEGYMNQFKI